MDSKLRCVFVEGEAKEPVPTEESAAPAAVAQVRLSTVELIVHLWLLKQGLIFPGLEGGKWYNKFHAAESCLVKKF